MNNPAKYKYHYRPEYGSNRLLIEFITGVENKGFDNDLFDAINEIEPILIEEVELWLNDEILYIIKSNLGQFTLSKDIWNFAFIVANDNQDCIFKINNLLLSDNRFEKVEVDFNDFKLDKNANS